jgi:hypothetical protein
MVKDEVLDKRTFTSWYNDLSHNWAIITRVSKTKSLKKETKSLSSKEKIKSNPKETKSATKKSEKETKSSLKEKLRVSTINKLFTDIKVFKSVEEFFNSSEEFIVECYTNFYYDTIENGKLLKDTINNYGAQCGMNIDELHQLVEFFPFPGKFREVLTPIKKSIEDFSRGDGSKESQEFAYYEGDRQGLMRTELNTPEESDAEDSEEQSSLESKTTTPVSLEQVQHFFQELNSNKNVHPDVKNKIDDFNQKLLLINSQSMTTLPRSESQTKTSLLKKQLSIPDVEDAANLQKAIELSKTTKSKGSKSVTKGGKDQSPGPIFKTDDMPVTKGGKDRSPSPPLKTDDSAVYKGGSSKSHSDKKSTTKTPDAVNEGGNSRSHSDKKSTTKSPSAGTA